MDDLKHQLMINQFVVTAGCLSHEAKSYLKSSHWQFEAALSLYFGESGIPHPNNHPNRPPANTPATPPAFPDTLVAFAKMETQDNSTCKLVKTSNQSATTAGGGKKSFASFKSNQPTS